MKIKYPKLLKNVTICILCPAHRSTLSEKKEEAKENSRKDKTYNNINKKKAKIRLFIRSNNSLSKNLCDSSNMITHGSGLYSLLSL